MPRSSVIAAIFALACLVAAAIGEETSEKPTAGNRQGDCCATVPCWCPDDYCRKPMPRIPCPTWCGRPDDYCKKPMPCLPCPARCGCPDDYCKRAFPDLCRPRSWQSYRCPPCDCPEKQR